jgi:AcrR family transcriptional regulator
MSPTVVAPPPTIGARLAAVPRPEPVMSRAAADGLTSRQQELLDGLTDLLADGFSHLTMADIAAELGCSLRTLYGIADSRDRLVLAACDRSLWATGRRARAALEADPAAPPLELVRRYLHAATEAVSATTRQFATDLAALPGGPELQRAHADHVVAITRELLEISRERGDVGDVDTTAVARAMAGVSTLFVDPDVISSLAGGPKTAADGIVDLILRGLRAPDRVE